MNSLTIFIMVVFWITTMTILLNLKGIQKSFHLADKRSFISGPEIYQKLNKLMDEGSVSIYTFDLYDTSRVISLKIEFADGSGIVEGTFRGENVDDVINQAYDWSLTRGYTEE